jgi:hypothetical protein
MVVNIMIESLVKRRIFATEEEAIRELISDYILKQIGELQQKISNFERKYGMPFSQFVGYLHEKSVLLERENFSPEQRRSLGQAIMQEEDDWLEWKASKEMLENWLGVRQEVAI